MRKIRIHRAMYWQIVVSTILLTPFIIWMVSRSMEQLGYHEVQRLITHQFSDTKKDVKNFLSDHMTLLQDVGSNPVIVGKAMGSSTSMAKLSDLLEQTKILGQVYPYSLYDFEGETLLRQGQHQSTESYAQSVVHRCLEQEERQTWKVFKGEDQQFYLCAVTPILFNGGVEGFLTMEVPMSVLASRLTQTLSETESLSFFVGEQKVLTLGGEVKEHRDVIRKKESINEMFSMELVLDVSLMAQEKKQLVFYVIVSILSFFLIMTLASTWAMKTQVVVPLAELSRYTQSYNPNAYSSLPKQDHSILEIDQLWERVREMSYHVHIKTKQLEKHRDSLEEKVKERTLELEKQARELEELTKVKSEFLANMSHEIRTPMNGIVGFSEFLDNMDLDDEAKDCVDVIQRSASSLLTILNDILDFSKLESGKMSIEKIPFDLQHVCKDMLKLFSGAAQANGVQLTVDGLDLTRSYLFLGDPTRIRQILSNLLSNAIKFTQDGEVAMALSFSELSDGNQGIIIEVRDQGIGIPSHRLDTIFESFTQADGSTTRKFGGTGLGLTISKRLSELLGGSLSVTSIEGKGSTFKLEMFLPPCAEKEAQAESVLPLVWVEEPKVLVVEDNAINQKLTMKILKKLNIHGQVANNGQEGVDMIETGDWDLVLMDVQMPVKNGLEATREVRSQAYGRALPIIGCTANALKEEQADCYDAGMSDILPKPFKQKEMEAILRKWLPSFIQHTAS